jgi:hypothetical protein
LNLACFFTFLQATEYNGLSYTFADSVFGTTFYMATGLPYIGPILFIIKRKFNYIFSQINYEIKKVEIIPIHSTKAESLSNKDVDPY